MFIGFANFYWCFIQGFSKITAPLISLLKTTELFKKFASKTFEANKNKVVDDSSDKTDKTVKNLSENLMYISNIKVKSKSTFLIPNAKKIFNHWQLAFFKVLIFWYFDLKNCIQIKTSTLSYSIGGILS